MDALIEVLLGREDGKRHKPLARKIASAQRAGQLALLNAEIDILKTNLQDKMAERDEMLGNICSQHGITVTPTTATPTEH